MTRSVYVIGGAGTGKSTFTAALLDRMDVDLGPLEDLHAKRNAKALVTLRGHRMYDKGDIQRGHSGLYLGVMRDEFPGSDGLDRATSPTGEEWLETVPLGGLPNMIVAEGATLATRRFLYALHKHTDLLVIALECDPVIHDLRLLTRGSNQDPGFILRTVTRSDNLVRDLLEQQATVRRVESDVPEDWEDALLAAQEHLAA